MNLFAIDFDDTLNRTEKIEGEPYNPIMDVVKFCKGKNFIVLTARRDSESNRKYISGFLKEHKLPYVKIYFTDSDPKAPVMEALLEHSEVSKVILIDDNDEQRSGVLRSENPNLLCFHPDEVNSLSDKIERRSSIKKIFNKISKKFFLNKIKTILIILMIIYFMNLKMKLGMI